MTSPDDAKEAPSGTVQGGQFGDHNIQHNSFYGATNVFLAESGPDALAAAGAAQAARQNWLRTYLTAARAAARQHPYAIALAGAPPLSTVYLRQYVGYQADQPALPAAGEPAAAPDPASHPDAEPGRADLSSRLTWEQRQRERGREEARAGADQISQVLQRLDINDVLSRHPAGLIVGGPGSGKSSLLRHLVDTAAGDWLEGGSGTFVPALIKAQSLLGSLPLHEAVAQAIRQSLGAGLGAIDLNAFLSDAPMPGVPWLILVDGLDEIFDAELRQRVMEIIAGWRGSGSPIYRFFVATRTIPQRELLTLRTFGMPAFEIQPFTDEQLPLLAASWLAARGVVQVSAAVGHFIDQIRQANLSLLARNPLIATIACVVFADAPGRGLPASRADLYEEFVTLLMDKPFTQGSPAEPIKARLGGYGDAAPLAVDKFLGELRGFIQDLAARRMRDSGISLRAAAEQLSATGRPASVPAARWNQVTAELLRQSGLLAERAGDLEFSHDTIMEYLAACALATSAPPRLRERWSLIAQVGRSESFALFRAAVLLRHGTDLTRKVPRLWQVRRLLHARLVAALVHDGCPLDPRVVQAAQEQLLAIATLRTSGIPVILRHGYWLEDDCVLAARSLLMLDKSRGFELLVRLAADPSVGGLNIFDIFAERMLTADFTDIDAEQGLLILAEVALVRLDPRADQAEDDYRRRVIAEFILERDAELGTHVMGGLAEDRSTSTYDRLTYIRSLVTLDRPRAVKTLIDIIADPAVIFADKAYPINFLLSLDQPTALRTLGQLAADPGLSDFDRVRAAATLGHYAPADGASAFRHLARGPKVMGFHRIYPYVGFYADRGRQADWLSGLAADPTLAGTWRIFAAEELLERDNDLGLAALASIARDTSVSRWTRARAGARVAVYRRVPSVAEPRPGELAYADSNSRAIGALLSRLRELALAVRGA
jgi:hypothetical protein